MIDLAVDEVSGTILTVGVGRWSVEEVEAYFSKLTSVIATFREKGRPIRFLRDVVGAEVQSPDIEALINRLSGGLYEEGDRIALVVKNDALMAHVRGAVATQGTALFSSHAAAEKWLFSGTA